MTATALIIDDEPDIRELIALTLSRMGLEYHTAANLEEARHLLDVVDFDVCLTDMRLPDGNGVEFVRFIHSTQPNLPVAVITAHGNMQAAVEAMKNGAYDFVSKPVDINLLRKLVVQAVTLKSVDDRAAVSNPVAGAATEKLATATDTTAQTENSVVNSAANDHPQNSQLSSLVDLSGRCEDDKPPALLATGAERLIGQAEPMQQLRMLMAKVARTNAPVWITGESGTGKEVIARLIHDNGPRAENPFVAINCGAIPSELMESEFFGHRKGSFTGAVTDHDGLFKRADGGTLFLDEVAELPLHMQVKLLRAIQERSIRAVGGDDETSVDVRILSASHKDLSAEVDEKHFRHDLYYRLNVISLTAPALRNRISDIPELAAHILKRLHNKDPSRPALELSQEAIDALALYAFPGNVRELENILERAMALSDNTTIDANDLSLQTRGVQAPAVEPTMAGPVQSINDGEKKRLINALNETRWNRKAAAEILGLTYRQLRYRIQQLGINSDQSDT